jgi:hypothetical protein
LLKGSATLGELKRLEAEAAEMSRRAAEQEAQLNRDREAFCRIPEAAARIKARLADTEEHLSRLRDEVLQTEYRRFYRNQLEPTATPEALGLALLGEQIATAAIRRSVIGELQTDLKAELSRT